MDTERLIECVRRHTFLYDVYHKEYKNFNLKTTIWELIGRELNQSGEAVKFKWKSIRDGYVKYKKQLKKSGSSKKNYSYLWSSQLSFLDNYRAPSSYVVTESVASPTSAFIQPRDYEVQELFSLPSNLSPLLSLEAPQTETSVPSTSRDRLKERNTQKNKKKVDHVDQVIKHLNKKNKKVDGIDHLFLSYAETFKRFPPKEQALLKLELAKLFSNTELKLLQQNSGESQTSWASPARSNSSSGNDTLQEVIDAVQPKEYCADIKKEEV